MAKGNMFQGMARGKVGDVVFSRLNGEQISRVRNRNPRNPRTNAQLYQRAIMATIMQAYSAGKAIFDHSFQTASTGAGCQQRFMSLNSKALRSLFAAEVVSAPAANLAFAHAIAPGMSQPVPNKYIISEGSLTQTLFDKVTTGSGGVVTGVSYSLPAITQGETIAQYCSRNNINTGDIYTFVFFNNINSVAYNNGGSKAYDKVLRCQFGFVRLIAKNNTANTTAIESTTPITEIFDIEVGGSGNLASISAVQQGNAISMASLLASGSSVANGYSLGLIKSRLDVDVRSNATMDVVGTDLFGLNYTNTLEAWLTGTDPLGNSDLILEGGDV